MSGTSTTRLKRLRWRFFSLRSRVLGRTVWRLYPPGVTRGPVACWVFRVRHGRPCSDQILREAWKASNQ